MKTLDHSSVKSFLADLYRHRSGVFRFKYRNDISTSETSPPWRLRSVSPTEHGVHIHIEYVTSCAKRLPTAPHHDGFHLRLDGGYFTYSDTVMMTVILENGTNTVDDSLRRRLDDNLKGVFS